jgi:hypothetical protein
LEYSGRFTPKADEPYQLPCSAPEPHARIRLHSKLLLNIYNAQQQASSLRAILNDSTTLLPNPRSQSDIRNRDRLSNSHLSTLDGVRSSHAGGDLPSGEADKLSFGHFGFLSRLCQRLNESVCVLINDKRSDGIVKGLPESGWRCRSWSTYRLDPLELPYPNLRSYRGR